MLKIMIKVHSFCSQNLVFINHHLMSALTFLKRFGEEDLIFFFELKIMQTLLTKRMTFSYDFFFHSITITLFRSQVLLSFIQIHSEGDVRNRIKFLIKSLQPVNFMTAL